MLLEGLTDAVGVGVREGVVVQEPVCVTLPVGVTLRVTLLDLDHVRVTVALREKVFEGEGVQDAVFEAERDLLRLTLTLPLTTGVNDRVAVGRALTLPVAERDSV